MNARKIKNRKNWTQIFKGQMENFDPNISLQYWRTRSTTEKFTEVQNLINQAKVIQKKEHIDGQKLLRSTALIKRA